MRIKQAPFKFSKFSIKQKLVLEWWSDNSPYKDKDGIICDGSIRAGKTVVMSLSFVIWAMHSFNDENFGMAGKTIRSLQRNVISPLKKMLLGRGYKVREHRADNYIEISIGDKTNYFYLFGGKDESSQDLIQGITLAGLFLDEVALMPESFVNQATGRCSVEGSKFWFNCNPDSPDHYFKKEWIDKLSEKNLIRIHFKMIDNPSLSAHTIERYERMYKGVFYDRFINGLWVVAAGLIFTYFAEDDSPYLFTDDELYNNGELMPFSKLVIGLDFGGNGSKTTMALAGYQNGYRDIKILEEDSLPITEQIDSKAICDKFIEFYKLCISKYDRVDWIFPDSASTTMIYSLISAAKDAGLRYNNIKGCRKNEIADRPKSIDMLFNTGRLKINKRCTNVRKAIASLRWDEKKPNIPEDINAGNCNDWYDAVCYTMLDFIEFIDLAKTA